MQGIIFISNNGESLPIVHRILLEQTPCEIYVHNPKARAKNYKGILPRLDILGLRKALRKWDTVVFDLTHPNDKEPWDIELLKSFGLSSMERAVFGPLADKLMKSHRVIGCSEWSEEIELDRIYGAQTAKKLGLYLPPAQEFPNLKAGLKFLGSNEAKGHLWVLKPFNNEDLDLTYVEGYEGELAQKFKNELPKRVDESKFHHMIQEVVDGTEISSEIWFDGSNLLNHNRTIEGKKFLCGNLGAQIGSQNNTVWICKDKHGIILKEMAGLKSDMQTAGYIGPADANCIIGKDGKAYFLEWSVRLGYDAIYCLLTLAGLQISNFFLDGFKVQSEGPQYCSSARITIPPFPIKDKKALREQCKDVPIAHTMRQLINSGFWAEDVYLSQGETNEVGGCLKVAGRDGIVGVQVNTGANIEESCKKVLAAAKSLRIGASKQYRIDLQDRPIKVRATLKAQGISID